MKKIIYNNTTLWNIGAIIAGFLILSIEFRIFTWLYMTLNNGLLSVIIPVILNLAFIIPLISIDWQIIKLIKSFLFWALITGIILIIVITWGDMFSSVSPDHEEQYFLEVISFELAFVAYFQITVIIVKLFKQRIED